MRADRKSTKEADVMSDFDQNVQAPVATAATDSAVTAEDEVVQRLGYRRELRRTLGFFSMFSISFSIISITTGIFLNYGFAVTNWGPASIWTWPIVGVGNLIVSFIIAELGTRIPLAGYAYQWSARLANSGYGWFVGFAGLLYMTVGGGSIMLLVAAPLLLSEFGITNPAGSLLVPVAIVLMVLPTVFNIVSVQIAARVNNVAVITEILGTVVFSLLVFVLWLVGAKHTPYTWSILGNTTNTSNHPTWYAFVLAALLGAYTLVGFELAADLSEDALNARASVPRAVTWAVAASGFLGMIALIGFTVAIPSIKAVEASSLPLVTIASYWLPSWIVKVFVALVVFSMFAILVAGNGAQARLAYSMARDNMLPVSAFLRRVDPQTQTPINALVVFTVIDVGMMLYGYFQPSAYGTLVGSTAIIPYIIYLAVTIAYALKRRMLDSIPGAFNLGRFAQPVIAFVIVYCLAIIALLAIPPIFRGSDIVLGYAAVIALIWYFAVLRRRLRRGEAGVKPLETMVSEVKS
jgi:amino acid transporter